MTPIQRAATAMEANDYVTEKAIDALMPQTTDLTPDEHRVLDRRGWNGITQDARRLFKVKVARPEDGHQQMVLFVSVTRDGRKVQARYPTLTRAEHPRWLADRKRKHAEDAVAIAIGEADAALFETHPKAKTVEDAWRMGGVQYTVERTGTE